MGGKKGKIILVMVYSVFPLEGTLQWKKVKRKEAMRKHEAKTVNARHLLEKWKSVVSAETEASAKFAMILQLSVHKRHLLGNG